MQREQRITWKFQLLLQIEVVGDALADLVEEMHANLFSNTLSQDISRGSESDEHPGMD